MWSVNGVTIWKIPPRFWENDQHSLEMFGPQHLELVVLGDPKVECCKVERNISMNQFSQIHVLKRSHQD